MRKILSFVFAMLMAGTVTSVMLPADTYAADCSGTNILGLGVRAWYAGLAQDNGGVCDIKKPGSSDAEMSTYFWTIALNVLFDLTLFIGYAAIIFVIWGGFKYIMSNGEPGKITQAKTMITNALIGLVIGILATIVVNTILVVVGGAAS